MAGCDDGFCDVAVGGIGLTLVVMVIGVLQREKQWEDSFSGIGR